ncbi:MAG TPA: hypothetical protein VFZ18_02410 [Longimicrobiaceae bacterium]
MVAALSSGGSEERGERFTTATERGDVRWHRALGAGLFIAVVVHLVLFFSFRTTPIPTAPFTAAGPDRGDVRAAAGGGEGLTMIELRSPAAPVAEEVPTPVPVPAPVPEIVVEPQDQPDPSLEEADIPVSLPGVGESGSGGEAGSATGPGTATGTGQGGGGADESGDAGLIAPRPRGILIPPAGRPASARGKEITVWVFVTPTGRVLTDSTRLEPPTSDGRYNNRLRQTVSDWVFEPARRAGQAVGAWYPFQIIL